MAGEPRELNQKTVIITGGGSGVGLECARRFAAQGTHVMIIGRSEDKLEKACRLIGYSSFYMTGDVTDPDIARQAMHMAKVRTGRTVDILINNAGTILRKTAEDTSDAEWANVLNINVTGVFYFSRAFARQATRDGAIVNVSSTCGQVGAAGLAAYCASKGAVNQLTRTMALELASQCITVNAVAPGAINSPMLFLNHEDPAMAESAMARNMETIPIGSVAEPEEVARAILFLAREKHITGTILSVDGGYTAL